MNSDGCVEPDRLLMSRLLSVNTSTDPLCEIDRTTLQVLASTIFFHNDTAIAVPQDSRNGCLQLYPKIPYCIVH